MVNNLEKHDEYLRDKQKWLEHLEVISKGIIKEQNHKLAEKLKKWSIRHYGTGFFRGQFKNVPSAIELSELIKELESK